MSGPPVFLARAEAGDLDRLLEIERDAAPQPWARAHFEAELEHGNPLVLRGRPGILAFCAARLVLDELHVRNLAVGGAWRRRGLGRRLLGLTLAWAQRAGARRAVLEVRASNRPARELYSRLGFAVLARRPGAYTVPPGEALMLGRDLGGPSLNSTASRATLHRPRS